MLLVGIFWLAPAIIATVLWVHDVRHVRIYETPFALVPLVLIGAGWLVVLWLHRITRKERDLISLSKKLEHERYLNQVDRYRQELNNTRQQRIDRLHREMDELEREIKKK